MSGGRRSGSRDVAFAIHGASASLIVLYWLGDKLARAVPSLAEGLQSIGALVMLVAAPALLVLVPAMLVLSVLLWRDWKAVLPGAMFVAMWALVVLPGGVDFAAIVAPAYVVTAFATSLDWFARRRRSPEPPPA